MAKQVIIESPSAPRPVGVTRDVADMLARIERNYVLRELAR